MTGGDFSCNSSKLNGDDSWKLKSLALELHDKLSEGTLNRDTIFSGLELLVAGKEVKEVVEKVPQEKIITPYIRLLTHTIVEDVINIKIPKGLGIQETFDACKKHFGTFHYSPYPLHEIVTIHDRDPLKAGYSISFKYTDTSLKNKSANDLAPLKQEGAILITLLETLLLELIYFTATKKHLPGAILCAGSCDGLGYTSLVEWKDGRLWVTGAGRDLRKNNLSTLKAIHFEQQ